METPTIVTMVRVYFPETSHSARKAQMDKVLHALREEFHVHGLTVLTGLKEEGLGSDLHYQTVGDVLRRVPDPPLIIEYFDESQAAEQTRRLLRELVPDSYSVYWQGYWERQRVKDAA
jgi:PII-like signaling protein